MITNRESYLLANYDEHTLSTIKMEPIDSGNLFSSSQSCVVRCSREVFAVGLGKEIKLCLLTKQKVEKITTISCWGWNLDFKDGKLFFSNEHEFGFLDFRCYRNNTFQIVIKSKEGISVTKTDRKTVLKEVLFYQKKVKKSSLQL